ncbi:MAG: filamentous hemagglutinin N-terminal domain-containing protein, partial [Burkholderiales bacterium]|nr:filamentous hemagglutinin N-terminal domain-containing protein [Burkholderiales bacterium]
MSFDRSSRPSSSRRHLRIEPLAWAVAVALTPGAAGALPQGGVLKQGQATIQTPQQGLMEIKQTSQTAGLDWRSFSVDKGETVQIYQPNAQSLLINRVIGYDPTRILGQINANGRVVLSNPRGVYFGAGSQVDVGSLVATTLGISDADLQSGRLRFGASTEGAGELRAEGSIRAADAVVLVAPQLSVNGSIDARRVGLAAASNVTVDVEGDGLVLFNVRNDDGLETRLNHLGQINATQSAELRAVARAGFADTVLNMQGVVRARSLDGVAGRVVVDGGSQGETWVNGKIDASGGAGQTGGDVLVQGQRIMLDSQAQIDASGAAGGGRIRVGGDFQGANPEIHNADMLVARPGARLTADATTQGDGGKVVLWSEKNTVYAGSLSARGGALGGDGGQAEVSGRHGLKFDGEADLTAAHGKTGDLLLDPDTIEIKNSGGSPITANVNFNDSPTALVISANTGTNNLSFRLNTANVTLQAKDTITVTDSVTGSNALTLRAGGDITVNASVSTTGLSLSAADTAGAANTTASGHVIVNSGGSLDAGTGALVLNNNGSSGAHVLGGPLSGATIVITGAATLTADAVWTANSGASSISGAIGESGGARKFTKDGGGTLSINVLGTYSGDTTIAGGTLKINGGNDRLPSGSGKGNVIINPGGTLDLAGNNQTVNGLSGFGTVDLLSGTNSTLTVGANNATSTFDGTIQNSVSTLALTKTGTGTLTLSGNNTYVGRTRIQDGAVSVGTLNSVAGSAATSNLGTPSSAANGTIDLGNGTTTGTLVYTGAGETTDRVVNLAGTTGGGVLDQSGTGLLKFTSALTATGAGSKTLTLQRSAGSSAAEIAGAIVDNSGTNKTALTAASGLWTLSGASTYSGKTSIQGGTVSVASLNSVAGGTATSNLGAPS